MWVLPDACTFHLFPSTRNNLMNFSLVEQWPSMWKTHRRDKWQQQQQQQGFSDELWPIYLTKIYSLTIKIDVLQRKRTRLRQNNVLCSTETWLSGAHPGLAVAPLGKNKEVHVCFCINDRGWTKHDALTWLGTLCSKWKVLDEGDWAHK